MIEDTEKPGSSWWYQRELCSSAHIKHIIWEYVLEDAAVMLMGAFVRLSKV
jgi:hypothetical protein